MAMANTLAYYGTATIAAIKSFIVLPQVPLEFQKALKISSQ
jgi:hypothetical protein